MARDIFCLKEKRYFWSLERNLSRKSHVEKKCLIFITLITINCDQENRFLFNSTTITIVVLEQSANIYIYIYSYD